MSSCSLDSGQARSSARGIEMTSAGWSVLSATSTSPADSASISVPSDETSGRPGTMVCSALPTTSQRITYSTTVPGVNHGPAASGASAAAHSAGRKVSANGASL